MSKIKQASTNIKVIILVITLIIALAVIRPYPGREGVAIMSIAKNTSSYDAGLQSPKPNVWPMTKEVITTIDNKHVTNLASYHDIIKTLKPGRTIIVETNKAAYSIKLRADTQIKTLPELEEKIVNVTEVQNINGTNVTTTVQKTIKVNKTEVVVLGLQDLGIRVTQAPTSNIKKGLDIQGGTRVLLKPERELTKDEVETIKENMRQRLNVYGLSDIMITDVKDFSGNQFFLIEISGVDEEEVRTLISREGKFEAKVGDTTVFMGGQDITYVCRSATCSGLDPNRPCTQDSNGQYSCGFYFQINLKPEAAARQAEATKDLAVVTVDSNGNRLSERNQILNETIDFYLDNKQVDKLSIGKDLRGRDVTNIQISGGGIGQTKDAANLDALKSMKTLQTILITGSLPVKLEVAKTDSISPVLGNEFLNNAMWIMVISFVVVCSMMYFKYKHLVIVAPIIITMVSEVTLTLAMAIFIGQNIDLAAIAGIIIVIGTGVGDQIVITDELLKKEKESLAVNWRERIKRAFFIVFSVYFVVVFGMIPLIFAGAGLLKGFAITTILGVTVGVLITRPAYAAACEILLKD